MEMNYYKQYEPIFGSWHITRLIGEGSFGKVFEMDREDFGEVYKAALKVITVPASESEVRSVMSEGMDEDSVRTYFGGFVKKLVQEFALMSKLKGNSNVVSYENHQVIEHKDGIGWDILIQMELLTPLDDYIRQKQSVSRQEIIRLGIDLCKALELCQRHNIIHRDIKPENIFISVNGDFKLGDFGVARTVEKTVSGLSKQGSYPYMAPEVYKGEAYGSTVDIYSLGLVLYRLLNGNRLPFLPAAPALITYADRESAMAKRFSGVSLPMPGYVDGRLGEIVLKACAYAPRDRYSSPVQMRQELEAILYNREEGRYIYPNGDKVRQDSVHSVKTEDKPPIRQKEGTVSDFGKTTSDFGATVSNFGKTTSDFGGTVSDFGKTISNFNGTVSDFGEAVRKGEGTVSDFEPRKPSAGKGKRASGGSKNAEKDDAQAGKPELHRIAAQMLPACAIVPLGPNQTTQALYPQCSQKECKILDNILKKYGLQQYGEILGYCGVILNITIPYAVMFTTTGIMVPVALKVSRFLLETTVRYTYVYLPYNNIRGLALCMEKNLQGIEIMLTGGEQKKMILPQDIYVHRTNVCKLIQALGRAGGHGISFQS